MGIVRFDLAGMSSGGEMNIRIPLLATFTFLLMLTLAHAELDSVSGWTDTEGKSLFSTNTPDHVAYSLANGFPIWYWDGTLFDAATPLKLQLCLDQAVQRSAASGGGIFFPCFLENPFAGPISFPNNFGPEAFWYAVNAATTYLSLHEGQFVAGGDMLFRADLEAAFGLDLGAFDGDQIAFSRIRLRISVPRPGIYEVTHPYGAFTYRVEDAGRRVINQTQDIGNKPGPSGPPPVGGDFTLALEGGEAPFAGQAPPAGFDFSVNAGIVDEEGRSIGPFLLAADSPGGNPLSLIQSVGGDFYLADPGFGLVHNTMPVTGSPRGTDFFQIRLLALLEESDGALVEIDPEGRSFFLNAADNSQAVRVDDFQVMGKLFQDLPNEPPTAEPVFVATAPGRAVTIDLRNHVRDEIVPGVNEYGLKLPLQAIALPTDPGDLSQEIKLTRPLTTDYGRVQRFTTVSTGVATFRYAPGADFTGVDTFHYVVQDEGGLISEPAQVTVLVEDVKVERAEYRVRTGKWRLEGTSSYTVDNSVTLYGGPRAVLRGATEAAGQVALFPEPDALHFFLKIDPLPVSAVNDVLIHLGPPGDEGPVIFELFFVGAHGPFTGSRSGTITGFISQPGQGINSFGDAVEAILSGNAHVNVRTAANPAGEIRGGLLTPEIGTAVVDDQGRWVFEGKSSASPGALPNISAESKNGVRSPGKSLQMR
jgi:hypothetical protein